MSTRRPQTDTELSHYLRTLDTPAPASLRASVSALDGEHAPRRIGRPAASAIALALAVAVLCAVLVAGGSATSAPSLATVTRLGTLPATEGAPKASADDPALLSRSVGGVAFPDLYRSGLRAVGARTDTLGGRPAVTVFYRRPEGRLVAYTILGGSPAPQVSGGSVTWRYGTAFHILSTGNRRVLAWVERGRLCVISVGGTLPRSLLRELTS